MTDRIDDTDLSEMHAMTIMAVESGFTQVTCDAKVQAQILAELRKLRRAVIVLTCAYCGHEYPAGTPAAGSDVAALTGHIATCEKHPMRALEALNATLIAQKRCTQCLARLPGESAGWIAVSERMPEFGVAVLIRKELWGDPELARLNGEGSGESAVTYCWLPDNTYEERPLSEVTMWHALPAPPKGEADAV